MIALLNGIITIRMQATIISRFVPIFSLSSWALAYFDSSMLSLNDPVTNIIKPTNEVINTPTSIKFSLTLYKT